MIERQKIVLVSSRRDQLGNFATGLREDANVDLYMTDAAEEAVDWVRRMNPVLVVVDNQTKGISALSLVQRLIMVNAFAQTAVLSDTSDEEFHHLSEGLGILAKLPILPGSDAAKRLLDQLRELNSADTTP